jgi:hypothetical protein
VTAASPGRIARRRAPRLPQQKRPAVVDRWADGIMKVHAEAAGLMQLFIIWPNEMLPLLASAMAGNAVAASLVNPMLDTIKRVQTAAPDAPAECGSCGHPLEVGAVICVALTHRPDPTKGVAFALCRNCTDTVDEVQARAIEAIRYLWPGGRLIEVTHPSGSAA